MLFIVKNPTQKTTRTGRPYAVATLIDEMGLVHEKVSIWSDHPDFGKSEVRGSITSNDKGKSLSKDVTYSAGTARPAAPQTTYVPVNQPNYNYKPAYSQDTKEIGIKTSSTIRMAVECANAELVQPFTPAEKLESIKKWRKILWEEWDYKETKSERPASPVPPIDDISAEEIPF